MISVKLIPLLVLLLLGTSSPSSAQESILRSVRECLRNNGSMVCLKEKALKMIDDAMASDQPVHITDYVDIIKDPNYELNRTDEETLPRDLRERGEKLTDLLLQRLDDFFDSRTVKFNLARAFDEGRGKKGGGGGKKGGGMMLMAGLAMAGMMGQMALGKITMMAGAALMISKMALLMSSIIGLKKLVGGGGGGDGGGTSHVVYTSSGGSDHGHGGGGGGGGGYGGGGGGWHRSLSQEEEGAVLAYNSYQKQNDVK